MKSFILMGIFTLGLTSAFAKERNGAFEARLERRSVAMQEREIKEVQTTQTSQQAVVKVADCDMPKCC